MPQKASKAPAAYFSEHARLVQLISISAQISLFFPSHGGSEWDRRRRWICRWQPEDGLVLIRWDRNKLIKLLLSCKEGDIFNYFISHFLLIYFLSAAVSSHFTEKRDAACDYSKYWITVKGCPSLAQWPSLLRHCWMGSESHSIFPFCSLP